VESPKFKTRSEMLAERRRAMLPPLSYDFNGDGVVRWTLRFLHNSCSPPPSPCIVMSVR